MASSSKPTITAIVHTKNSQQTLDRCLSSLSWCDDVFVVDMESTDETLHIAKKHKATVFHEKSSIRFADPIRDQYIKKVQTDWTFIVDSDEEVPATLAAKIRALIASDEYDGFHVPRKNIIFDRWIEYTGFWPDYILRLFRTGKGSYPPYVHAQPQVKGAVANIQAKEEFALIHHHYNSIEQFLLRLNVYTSLEADKFVEQNPGVIISNRIDFLKAFFDQFFTRFFSQKGYKDGVHGLVLSLLMGVYMMVVQMKLWEKQKANGAIDPQGVLNDVEASVNAGCSATMYWVANEKIESERNMIEKIKLKIRRKISLWN